MAEASAPAGSLLFVFGLVALWYAVNIGVVIFNKYVLSSEHFENAAFLTLCHMSACVLVGYFIQGVVGWFPLKPLVSKQQFYKVAVLSVIFLGSIVLANASLEYIPVSFNQAIGATTPLFTALFAVVILQKQETWLTYCTLIPIVIGIIIASGGEPVFHVLGFSLALIATSSRALKTVVQSMLMTDPKEKLDPMSLLLYMSVCAWILLIPVTLITEPGVFQVAWARCAANPRFMWSLVANSLMAYVLNLVNFLVTKYTSALTQQVLGQGKGLLGAIISVMIFKNKVRAQGWVGYCLAVAGVLGYTFSKRFKPKSDPPAIEQALAHKVALNGGGYAGLNGAQRDDEESPLLPKEQAVSTAVAGGHSGRTTPRHTSSGNRGLGDL